MKNKCFTVTSRKMLDGYALKRTRFSKSCRASCWFHQFFWEMEFAVEGNKFLSRLERHTFVNRLIKKYTVERDLDYYFSREAIDGLMIDCGKNWNECLELNNIYK